jgi:hypothetical protein
MVFAVVFLWLVVSGSVWLVVFAGEWLMVFAGIWLMVFAGCFGWCCCRMYTNKPYVSGLPVRWL